MKQLKVLDIDLSKNNIGSKESYPANENKLDILKNLKKVSINLSWNDMEAKNLLIFDYFFRAIDNIEEISIDLSRNEIN